MKRGDKRNKRKNEEREKINGRWKEKTKREKKEKF